MTKDTLAESRAKLAEELEHARHQSDQAKALATATAERVRAADLVLEAAKAWDGVHATLHGFQALQHLQECLTLLREAEQAEREASWALGELIYDTALQHKRARLDAIALTSNPSLPAPPGEGTLKAWVQVEDRARQLYIRCAPVRPNWQADQSWWDLTEEQKGTWRKLAQEELDQEEGVTTDPEVAPETLAVSGEALAAKGPQGVHSNRYDPRHAPAPVFPCVEVAPSATDVAVVEWTPKTGDMVVVHDPGDAWHGLRVEYVGPTPHAKLAREGRIHEVSRQGIFRAVKTIQPTTTKS